MAFKSTFSNEETSDPIAHVRKILVNTLSIENISQIDRIKVRRIKNNVPDIHSKVDKGLRLRNLKDKQNENRQKKMEDIKAQEVASQKLKEEIEMGRRKRLEELRIKEDIRRQQVEERKRVINEAEKDRLEFILKRNQEREARIDARKRNDRSSIVFAFGSSTPRMLDPIDHQATFWGHRRATSTQNITSMSTSLTRRQSERDLDSGSKKRATSASGLERSGECSTPVTPAGCVSGYAGRRRTDLMPTIPSRDSPFSTSRKSLTQSPGRAYSMTRLDQLAKPRKRPDLKALPEPSYSFRHLSTSRQSSVTRSMSHLAVTKESLQSQPRKPLNKSDSRSMHMISPDGAVMSGPRPNRATQLRQQKLLASSNSSDASSRPSSALSQQSTTSVASSSVSMRHRTSSGARRQRPASIAVTGISHSDLKNAILDSKKGDSKPPIPKTRKSFSKSSSNTEKKPKAPQDTTPRNLAISPTSQSLNKQTKANNKEENQQIQKPPDSAAPKVEERPLPQKTEKQLVDNDKSIPIIKEDSNKENIVPQTVDVVSNSVAELVTSQTKEELKQDVETSNIVVESDKPTTEEINQEAKLIDFSSVETNVSNQQQNNELVTEKTVSKPLEPEIIEEKQPSIVLEDTNLQNTNEKESIDLMNQDNGEMTSSMIKPRINTEEEAKAALAERRRLAREEAEKQAEQERIRVETEARLELERQQREEEQQRILIEQQRAAEQERLQEAIREAQKREEEERLKREEEQRQRYLKEEADRKAKEENERQKAELQERLKNEEKEREARRKRVEAIMLRTRGKNNANSTSQNSDDKNENKSENQMNGRKAEEQENGTKNGKNIEIVDNIMSDETLKNANNVSLDGTSNTDSINSNNSIQPIQIINYSDSLM